MNIFFPNAPQNAEHTPSQHCPQDIVENIIEFKQPQFKIKLTQLNQTAYHTGNQHNRPQPTARQCIGKHKAKREKKQDIIQDLHTKLNIFPKNPRYVGPKKLQLITALWYTVNHKYQRIF